MESVDQLKYQLDGTLASLQGHWAEMILAIGIVVIIIIDLIFYSKGKSDNWWLGIINLIFVSIGLLYQALGFTGIGEFMKLLILSAGVIFNLISATNRSLKNPGEYYPITNGLIIGALLVTNGTNLITIYLGIELMSISAYLLSGFSFNKKGAEASLKYLLFGAVASAIMLFGMSLLYGFTKTLEVSAFDLITATQVIGDLPVKLAVFMMLFGLFFKIAATPMHIWSPDIYEAAPTPIVALFSVVPKLAIFSLLITVGDQFLVLIEVRWLFQFVVFLSLSVGNFAALWQNNTNRLLAYSSIAHTGFLLMALFANPQGLVFYAIIYAVMNFGAFGLVYIIEMKFGVTDVRQYCGLGKQVPIIGVLFLVVMLSLTGLPPTAGFMAKFFLFSGVWETYLSSGDQIYLWLFVFGLLNTVVSLFYYLKIPYYLFIKKEQSQTKSSDLNVIILNYLMLILAFVLILWFFIPNSLMDIVYSINFGI